MRSPYQALLPEEETKTSKLAANSLANSCWFQVFKHISSDFDSLYLDIFRFSLSNNGDITFHCLRSCQSCKVHCSVCPLSGPWVLHILDRSCWISEIGVILFHFQPWRRLFSGSCNWISLEQPVVQSLSILTVCKFMDNQWSKQEIHWPESLRLAVCWAPQPHASTTGSSSNLLQLGLAMIMKSTLEGIETESTTVWVK